MMTCREVIDEFLMAYVASELSLAERLRFRFHLIICPPCLAYVRSYRQTIKIGKAALQDSDAPVSPEVPEKLVRAILASRKNSSR